MARRPPHSVVSVVTSHERDVKVGERLQYSHASSTKPRPQQTSTLLASRSLRLSIHTRVSAARIAPRPASAASVPVTTAWVSATPARRPRSRAAALRAPRNLAQHPSEYEGVNRNEHIPVEKAWQSDRLEHGGLVDDDAADGRHNVQLEPCAPRQPPISAASLTRRPGSYTSTRQKSSVSPTANVLSVASVPHASRRCPSARRLRLLVRHNHVVSVPPVRATNCRDGNDRAVRVDGEVNLPGIDSACFQFARRSVMAVPLSMSVYSHHCVSANAPSS